ncbi:MAG: Methyltransferase type 11 [Firmicutes bacterium]|nr:Methyltransferase type 11 [Bacillota bacterium]
MSSCDSSEAVRLYSNSSEIFNGGIFAKMPDGVLRPGGLALTERLVDACAFSLGAQVVDLGCGTGITVEYLRSMRGLDAVGVDLADALLAQGRSRFSELPLIRADGEKLPFGDRSLDGVLAECSLSVTRDIGKVLNEIQRVLLPGGKLALTDIYIQDSDCASRVSQPGACCDCITGVMTRGQFIKVLKDAGFSVILWEDHSALLKEFVASFIMRYGSPDELWQCISVGKKAGIKAANLGYCLLVAEKCRRG